MGIFFILKNAAAAMPRSIESLLRIIISMDLDPRPVWSCSRAVFFQEVSHSMKSIATKTWISYLSNANKRS